TNSQSALNNATNDNQIASNDTDYTKSSNPAVAKDAQSLEKTNQQIQQDEQALENDLTNVKQLANSTTGFNEQAFKNAQSQEQQDEQTLQNEENAFNSEQEGLQKALANAKHASPTPTPTPNPTKHTAQNTPPTQDLPKTNVWSGVYNLQNQTYSKQGIYYIDPNNQTLYTYSSLGGSFGVNANNGTLIIGNDTESANTKGLIQMGGMGWSGGDVGYITG
ncbi:hypothetical protein, partial [Helicobacter pylori]|uniref:hypothetical protein n=2 Tax=Helicobacter pylori TaxID=210 RepID=UPI0005346CB0